MEFAENQKIRQPSFHSAEQRQRYHNQLKFPTCRIELRTAVVHWRCTVSLTISDLVFNNAYSLHMIKHKILQTRIQKILTEGAQKIVTPFIIILDNFEYKFILIVA